MKTILEVVRDLIKPYIDTNASNIATVEDSTVENPYYVDDQLIYKGVLYNVTADISIGDTLEIGTNISVAPKLSNSIKSALNKLKSNGTSSGTDFNFDIQNGVPGWNSASNRGSSTFHPFSAGSTASDISYDNTTSGLTATDVQTAIDEVDSEKLPTYTNDASSWDTTPTANSTKPVTSGGVKAQFDAVTNEFTDVNNITGAKNLGLANIAGNYVAFGITWNMLSDGSITASGTPTQESGSGIYLIGKFTLPAGTYTITSGITDTELNERAYTFIRTTSNNVVLATSNNSQSVTNTFTLSTAIEVEFGCHIYGSTAINVHIFPMCRVASVTDDTYVPYAMTNKQLTEKINDLKNKIYNPSDLGVGPLSGGWLSIAKYGDVVSIQFNTGASFSAVAKTWTKVHTGTFPAGFRPRMTFTNLSVNDSKLTDIGVYTRYYNSGEISVWFPVAVSNNLIVGSATFVVNDT